MASNTVKVEIDMKNLKVFEELVDDLRKARAELDQMRLVVEAALKFYGKEKHRRMLLPHDVELFDACAAYEAVGGEHDD